jgi:hypothetical protein
VKAELLPDLELAPKEGWSVTKALQGFGLSILCLVVLLAVVIGAYHSWLWCRSRFDWFAVTLWANQPVSNIVVIGMGIIIFVALYQRKD